MCSGLWSIICNINASAKSVRSPFLKDLSIHCHAATYSFGDLFVISRNETSKLGLDFSFSFPKTTLQDIMIIVNVIVDKTDSEYVMNKIKMITIGT